jgi:hypothetical protein
MSSKRAGVASAALDLVKASNPQDETFVINFSDQAYLHQDFTSDLDKLQNGLSHLSLSGGNHPQYRRRSLFRIISLQFFRRAHRLLPSAAAAERSHAKHSEADTSSVD